jgi:hypothetical protein
MLNLGDVKGFHSWVGRIARLNIEHYRKLLGQEMDENQAPADPSIVG